MVSVIVPVYNTEQFLEECIQSIVNQTYKELEIILINDGSTDASGNICRKWEQLDKRIKYIEKKNEGQGIARNIGIQIASGEYIIFVDSDDYIDLDLVDKVYTCIHSCKADICVYSHRHIGECVREWSLEGKTKKETNVRENKEVFGLMLPILCNKMFSTDLIRNSNVLMNNRMCEDLVFNAQLYVKANKICFLDIPLYNYRYMRDGNFSTNYKKFDEVAQSVNELIEIFCQNKNFEIYWIQLYELSLYIFKNILFRIKNRKELHLPIEAENRYDEFIKVYKNHLSKWFSRFLDCNLQEKKYLILGSYNLRVIIHSLLLNEEFCGNDYGYSSIVSLMSAPIETDFSIETYPFKNPYRKRCVKQDIEKEFYCNADLQDKDYLVMDLLDEIFDLIDINNGYITESEFLKEVNLLEKQSYRKIPFLCEERRRLFEKYVSKFAEKVNRINIPVILIKNFLCEKHSKYYDVFVEYDDREYIRKINQELEWCYQKLCKCLFHVIVVDASEFKELVFTHEDFPFGCKPFYYNHGYYQRIAIQMSCCIRNGVC